MDELTANERNVILLVSHGFSYEEVAREMEYSQEWVKDQMESLRKKLGARNRSQAVAQALRRGVIS